MADKTFGEGKKKLFSTSDKAKAEAAENLYSMGPSTDDEGWLPLILGITGAVVGGAASGGNPAAIAGGMQGGRMLGAGIEGSAGAKTSGEFARSMGTSMQGASSIIGSMPGSGGEGGESAEGAEGGEAPAAAPAESVSALDKLKARQTRYTA